MLQSKNAAGKQAPHTNAFKYAQNLLITALVILGLLVAPVVQAVDTAGATSGELTVTPTGAANYRIPIVVPPGITGMAPRLELVYNSQGGNGLLGMGWGISGLSAINRCHKTLIQEGVKKGISYTNADKYCLNGQRLVAISGDYGANGTEYRTERESYSKILSYDSNGYGPGWFKVWTKAGQILELGHTPDSAIEAQGKTAIRVWAVNKISDSKGNYLTVSYTDDNTNGQYYPVQIDYTGNVTSTPVLAPTNSVHFLYISRPDITPLYDGGSMISNSVRLTNIQTHAKVNGADKVVKDYRLGYNTSAATQRSRLLTITECDGEATPSCFRPTTLSSQSSDNVYIAAANSNLATVSLFDNNVINSEVIRFYGLPNQCSWWHPSWLSNRGSVSGDFNGDGKSDILIYGSSSDNSGVLSGSNNELYLADANGSFTASTNFNLKHVPIFHSYATMWDPYLNCQLVSNYSVTNQSINFRLGDFNGDGKSDILVSEETNSHNALYLSNGDGTFTQSSTFNLSSQTIAISNNSGIQGTNPYAGWAGSVLGDFNGDGRTDILRYVEKYPSGSGYVNVDAPSLYATQLSNTPNALFLSNGDGTFTASPNFNLGSAVLSLSAMSPYTSFILGDFNGDGQSDILIYADDYAQNKLYLSNGDGSFNLSANFNLNTAYLGLHNKTQGFSLGDFNGDGKADVLIYADNYTQNKLYLSKGDGTFTETTNFNLNAGYLAHSNQSQGFSLGDFNGDGKADVLQYSDNFSQNKLYLSNGDGSFHEAYTNTQSTVLNNNYLSHLSSSQPEGFYLADFNGDGKADILKYAGDISKNAVYWEQNAVANDYLQNISDGLGAFTTLTYKSLTDGAMYTKGTGSVYPVMDLQASLYVVSNVADSDGIGGSRVVDYRYVGAKSHLRGGGLLGFSQIKTTDAEAGIFNITTYGQGKYGSDISCSGVAQIDSAYPYCLFNRGLPLASEKRTLADVLLNGVTNTWSFATNALWSGQYHALQLTQSVESRFELSGVPISTVTTSNIYDGFGNPTTVTSTSSDGYSKTTTSTYTNDTAKWYLGRLTSAVVTSTSPDTVPSAPPTSFTPVISIAAYSADKAEGNSGATPFTFTVARTSSTSGTSSVIWAVTGSGASPATAVDFVGEVMPSGTASFSAGQTSKTLTVNVQGNTTLANDKEFKVTLSNPVNASLGTSVAAGTIQNDDTLTPPVISIAALSADKAEGNSGSTGFTYTVSRSGTVTPSSTAHWAVTGSSAAPANAADFTGSVLPSGLLTFAAGETTLILNINVQGENDYEVDEGFTVTLSAPENSTLGTYSATGIIRNDASDAYTFQEIAANTVDYNLRAKAIAAGWNQVAPLNANITVNGGVVISASSTATPAFTIDGSYPAGSIINLDNKAGAYIVGKGGAGANPNGLPGGLAMRIAPSAATVRITNNGVIGGGGGGGGYGGAGWKFSCDNGNVATGTQYGGGGAGYGPGPGAVGGLTTGGAGATLNGSVSGSGGGLGTAGGNGHANSCQYDDIHYGGAGGAATLGAANASWLVTGTRLGAVQ